MRSPNSAANSPMCEVAAAVISENQPPSYHGDTASSSHSSTDFPNSTCESPVHQLHPGTTFMYKSMNNPLEDNELEGSDTSSRSSPQPPYLIDETLYRSTSFGESGGCGALDRKVREFIPESKKDDKYWERRKKNNEAAKRSREKRRQNDQYMEQEIAALKSHNEALRWELNELKARFGVDERPLVLPPVVEAPTPVAGLDLLSLQRLLAALATSNASGSLLGLDEKTQVANVELPHSPSKKNGSDQPTETPLDLRLPLRSIEPQLPPVSMKSPDEMTKLQKMQRLMNGGKLSELAVFTGPGDSWSQLKPLPPSSFVPEAVVARLPSPLLNLTLPHPLANSQSINSHLPVPPAPTKLANENGTAIFLQQPLGVVNAPKVPVLGGARFSLPSQHLMTQKPQNPVNKDEDDSKSSTTSSKASGRKSTGDQTQSSSQLLDERYRERRRRNNEAVRRCRENKRARINQRDEVTGRLQTENLTLRSELEGLSNEVQVLRSMIQLSSSSSSQTTPSAGEHNSTPIHRSPTPQIIPHPPPQKQPSPDVKRESDNENHFNEIYSHMENYEAEEKQQQQQQIWLLQTKESPQYALPKKGIPRLTCKRRFTNPSYNPSGLTFTGGDDSFRPTTLQN